MDITTIGGIIAALVLFAVGDILEGGNPAGLIHISSIIIVVPTTLSAAAVATKQKYVAAAYKELKIVFGNPQLNPEETLEQIIKMAEKARKEGILAIESDIGNIEDPFFRKGLQMLVDGLEPEVIRERMELEIGEIEEYYEGAAKYWITAGETTPVFGLVGAVMGLILALKRLENPVEMAEGIAGAFTATVTGIVSSYLLFGPWGHKMKAKSKDIIKTREMILEGIIGISLSKNPKMLREQLMIYTGKSESKEA